MRRFARGFGLSAGLSALGLGYVLLAKGVGAGLVALVLAAIELAFSFDNAVINARVVARLSPWWRGLFLSVGIVIAIFGVRALLPIAIVSLTAHLPLGAVLSLALRQPAVYGRELTAARPAITAFGGAFLLVLALQFFMAEREVRWIRVIERPLSRLARWWLPFAVTLVVIAGLATLPVNRHHGVSLAAGLAGLLAYGAVDGLVRLLGRTFAAPVAGHRTGRAALATFLYLEVLDASLSFDGVIGAFAITGDVVLIAVGLGIGAVWVRSLTVHMVRHSTLAAYRYLEHGAHYAITVLAATMLLGVVVEIPDALTGFLCLGLIAAAAVTSRQVIDEQHGR